MAPQTESTRVVIVRPTRDGDHIIINVTFSKYQIEFTTVKGNTIGAVKYSVYTALQVVSDDCKFSKRMSVCQFNFVSACYEPFWTERESFLLKNVFLGRDEIPLSRPRHVRFGPNSFGWYYKKPVGLVEVLEMEVFTNLCVN